MLIHKDVFREIKKSMGRFVSLFLIVVLGVAFYSGIRSCESDMLITADKFYDETNLMDLRVISTLGLTDKDISEIKKIDEVKEAIGTYSTDMLCKVNDTQQAVKVKAISDGMNEIVLKSGIMPVNTNECLLDQFFMEMYEFNIGDKITFFAENEDDVNNYLSTSEFVIVGSFISSEYLSMDMGTTTIGAGKLDGIIAVPKDAFSMQAYTEIDITVKDTKDLLCYSDEYDEKVDVVEKKLKKISKERENDRYDTLVGDANKEINEGQEELDKEKANIYSQLYSAQNSLNTTKSEIDSLTSAYNELLSGLEEFDGINFDRIRNASQRVADIILNGFISRFIPQYIKNVISNINNKIQSIALTIEEALELRGYASEVFGPLTDTLYQTLDSMQMEINSKWAEANEGFNSAQEEIDSAKEEISKVEKPTWFILDRYYLQEYLSYKSDTKRIGNIGKVFPVVFFIVAALVCLTTMTRMVDEERTQIGTLKALGYSKGTIISKYIIYAMLATVSGSIVGAIVGSKTLPLIIINVYKLLYPNLQGLEMPLNLTHCLVASLAAIICILAATLFACLKSLLEVPANLMRPVAPKQARKLLIERIEPLWRKISFTWKSALRNFVRYKKRLFMTLFGICGSTALLLVGFGLKDAINTILYAQYGDINKYNEVLYVDENALEEDKDLLTQKLNSDNRVKEFTYVYQTSVDAESKNSNEVLNSYIFVPKNTKSLDNYIVLQDRVTKERKNLDNESVLISEKMANQLNLKEGDTISFSVGQKNKQEAKVGGIVENYIYHYIYMSPSLYEKIYDKAPKYNQIVICNNEEVTLNIEKFSEEYMSMDAVGGIMDIESMKDKFSDMLKGLDSITLVLIICAGALTFVVLFNLNNINIGERRRELATLKVLGFHDIELSQYIYRENVLITAIGIALGVVAGIFLNKFVVTTVEVDIVMFGREIFATSFLYSILIAIGFTVIVNIIVHFKLKKIDMAMSLKSVE